MIHVCLVIIVIVIINIIVYHLGLFSLEAAVTKLEDSPSNPSIATEAQDLTLVWNYTLGGSVFLGRIFIISDGKEDEIARRELNSPTNVQEKYKLQGRFYANISDTHAWLRILQVQQSDGGQYAFSLFIRGSSDNLRNELKVVVNCKY